MPLPSGFASCSPKAGLKAVAQRVYRGPAPFLITEAVAAEPIPVIPAPHFRFLPSLATASGRVRPANEQAAASQIARAERPD